MNAQTINFTTPKGEYRIPNRWELLSPEQYLFLCGLLARYRIGEISFRQLHLAYICAVLDLDPTTVKDAEAFENLYLLSEQIDFIFSPDKKLNACFLGQLVPNMQVRKTYYKAYTIHKDCDMLTSSLTAIQFIEAYELIDCPAEKLPLLAAILYFPGKYTSEAAHVLAGELSAVYPVVLQAIALNFSSFVNYIFLKTPYSILRTGKTEEPKAITISMSDSLYNLSADGLGDASTIEQLPVLKYLSILRKKLIESVRAMHVAEIDLMEISNKTGLTIKTIKQII